MKSKLISFFAVAVVAAVTALMIGFSRCSFGVFSDQDLQNPKQTIVDFIETLQTEDFNAEAADAALGYVANYSTMGFEEFGMVEDDPVERDLFDALRMSYDVSFRVRDLGPVSSPYSGEDLTVSGKQAFVTCEFTSLDFSLMAEPLTRAVTSESDAQAYEGVEFDTEEKAMALVEEVYFTLFGDHVDMGKFYVTRQITLELRYDDGWKIVVSDEFYDALLGR